MKKTCTKCGKVHPDKGYDSTCTCGALVKTGTVIL
jgi:hypothetical protein